jgi:hypothetical protein
MKYFWRQAHKPCIDMRAIRATVSGPGTDSQQQHHETALWMRVRALITRPAGQPPLPGSIHPESGNADDLLFSRLQHAMRSHAMDYGWASVKKSDNAFVIGSAHTHKSRRGHHSNGKKLPHSAHLYAHTFTHSAHDIDESRMGRCSKEAQYTCALKARRRLSRELCLFAGPLSKRRSSGAKRGWLACPRPHRVIWAKAGEGAEEGQAG